MKVLVLSDSHGSSEVMVEIFKQDAYRAVVFLGDCVRDSERIYNFAQTPVYRVKGNCDFYDLTPDELIIELMDKRVLITHGHKFLVKQGLANLKAYAQKNNIDIALFGHTHLQYSNYADGLLLANPGSIAGGKYGVLTIDKTIEFELRDINYD